MALPNPMHLKLKKLSLLMLCKVSPVPHVSMVPPPKEYISVIEGKGQHPPSSYTHLTHPTSPRLLCQGYLLKF